jgi:hypothetical protein
MKLTVSVSRKIGQPQFGSEGASCGMEIDIEQSSLDNPGLLADRIRAAFQLVELAVENQLERAAEPPAPRREPLREDLPRPGDPAYDRIHPPAPQPVQQPVPQPPYDRESDHQAFMRRCEQKKREEQATAAAWAAQAGRGAYPVNNGSVNGNVRH